MDKKKEEFLAKLRETFKVEASEHLMAISAGLLAMEHAGGIERAAIVESVFREAHSLKGAARSVSLGGVEAICLEMESIFAAMKRAELRLSAEKYDAIHSALEVLRGLCASPGAPLAPQIQAQEQEALSMLKRIAAGWASTPAAAKPALETRAQPLAAMETNAPTLAKPETVRISTQKLNAILLESEELIGAKIAENERAAELRALASDLAAWNQKRGSQGAKKGPGGGGNAAVSDLLETEMHYTRKLESTLRKMAKTAQQDARALAASTDRLLGEAKSALLLPCSSLLSLFPKLVRDLAREQGKEIDLSISGEDIEIDRRVLDELRDPFIHLLRNCVDHGIEKPETRLRLGKPGLGSISLAVKQTGGNRVEITVADDGAGIDAGKVRQAAIRLGLVAGDEAERLSSDEAIGLVFHSGLSTSPIITDLSGRGLGLAIVREKVEKLGGSVNVGDRPGGGTIFRVLISPSLAAFRGVLVGVAGRRFLIPTASVARVGRVKPEDIKTIENRQTIALGAQPVSLVRLRDVLELSGPVENKAGTARPMVAVRSGGRQMAFLVDEVHAEQEVMVKSLGGQLTRVRNIAGGCITGSGAVIPILDAADLVESGSKAGAPEPGGVARENEPQRHGRLLVAEDSITARTLLKGILEGVGYEVTASVDGLDALTQLKTGAFDLLVSDVDMPRMNGFELTSKIRADKKLAELPVVLVTALGSQKDREYGIGVGANAYIVKSDFDQSNLLEIIHRLL